MALALPAALPSDAAPLLGAPGGAGTLVLVEPDPSLRDVLTDALTALGHRVHAAASPAQAERWLERLEGVSLLLLDTLDMPTAQHFLLALRRRPGGAQLPVVTMGLARVRPAQATCVLEKPFTLEALEAAVEDHRRPVASVPASGPAAVPAGAPRGA
jgi:DNA-binding response OmpR family regulator